MLATKSIIEQDVLEQMFIVEHHLVRLPVLAPAYVPAKGSAPKGSSMALWSRGHASTSGYPNLFVSKEYAAFVALLHAQVYQPERRT